MAFGAGRKGPPRIGSGLHSRGDSKGARAHRVELAHRKDCPEGGLNGEASNLLRALIDRSIDVASLAGMHIRLSDADSQGTNAVPSHPDGTYKTTFNGRTIATGDTQNEAGWNGLEKRPNAEVVTQRVRDLGIKHEDQFRRLYPREPGKQTADGWYSSSPV